MTIRAAIHHSRVGLRLETERRQRIEAAARLNGASLSDFIREAADDKARSVLLDDSSATAQRAGE